MSSAPRCAVLLVDHGSRVPEANALLLRVAEGLARRMPKTAVHTAHMEFARPNIAEGIAACVAAGAQEVWVHPYFLAPGRHCSDDIPRLVREAAARHVGLRLRLSEPLGLHEKLLDVVLERLAASSPLV